MQHEVTCVCAHAGHSLDLWHLPRRCFVGSPHVCDEPRWSVPAAGERGPHTLALLPSAPAPHVHVARCRQVIGGMPSQFFKLGVRYRAPQNIGRLLIARELARLRGRGFVKRALAILSSAVPRRASLLNLPLAVKRALAKFYSAVSHGPHNASLQDLLKVAKRVLAKFSSAMSLRPHDASWQALVKAHERGLLAYAVGQVRRKLRQRAKGQALTQWCVVTLSIACISSYTNVETMVPQVCGQLRPSRRIGPRIHSAILAGGLPGSPDPPARPHGPGYATPPASRRHVRSEMSQLLPAWLSGS